MNKIQERRLEKLASILDTADAEHRKRGEPSYCQLRMVHGCSTPACALGHWASHNPRRWRLSTDYGARLKKTASSEFVGYATEEFGISRSDALQIFGTFGCDYAATAKQAARYIRRFLARKRKERKS